MKVLFVDDEKIVRDGMRTVIDWEKNGCQSLLVAQTVQEALAMLDEHRPDLVITDINMNEVDGIELAHIIRRRYPEIVVVVLSGYENFQYARRALEAGVVKYLLKPLYPAELEELIAEMRAVARARRNSREQIEVYKPIALESIWRSLLYRRYNRPAEMEARARRAGLSVDGIRWQVVKAVAESKGDAAKTEALLREALTPLFIADMPGDSWLLVLDRESEPEGLARIAAEIRERDGHDLMFAVGQPVDSLLDLHLSEHSAQKAAGLRERPGAGAVLTYRETRVHDGEKDGYPQQAEREVLDMLRFQADWDPAPLSRFFSALSTAPGGDAQWDAAMVRLLSAVHRAAEELPGLEIAPFHDQMARLSRNQGREQNEVFFAGWIQDMMAKRREAGKNDTERMADHALRILEQEFHNPSLTLNEVARQLHISQGYLSRLFKKYCGAGAAEYLTALRIAEAKKLLRSGGKTQSEIAVQVGYSNVYYFSTQFKKVTGMTPGDYKKRGNSDA